MTNLAVGVLLMAAACRGRTVSVSSGAIDTLAIQEFRTFAIMTPTPTADTVAVGATNGRGRASGIIMDLDPMLSTSVVGRAIREDLANAFKERGYQAVEGTPDFYVAYYAGTGHLVDTRSSQRRYRAHGQQITTNTFVYPAGTIVVDVVDAQTDSLVWRGTGVATISKDPNDYARAIHQAVDEIVETFPRAQR
jgi:uncharacterized membrane protein YgcG